MTKPVTIPNTFATATTAIPLSNLDADFSTVATAMNDANTYSNYAPDTGSANAYVVTLTGVSTAYSAGLRIQFKAGNANTTASTLNVNAQGAKNITYQDASALASGTIAANSIVDVMYDGTQFLLMNDPAGGTGGDVVGPASATDNAIVRFDGTTGKLVQNSVVTIADSTGDISGVGQLNATTVDATNVEVTNIKAKDGTAAATIADSTGVVSITANPVLSGGTANGVLYLDGSKVATSGSALTFDGGSQLTIAGNTTNTTLSVKSTVSETSLQNISNDGYLNMTGTGGVIFRLGASYSEQMRLTSTGLGIGTSSPGAKLHVSNGVDTDSGNFTGLIIGGSNATNARTASLIKNTSTPYDLTIRSQNNTGTTSGSLFFQNGSTTQMTLDSSGNLGLGVTPSAWQSGRKAFQVGYSSMNSYSNSQIQLGANFYYDGTNNKYITTDYATVYQQINGQHQWYIAPSSSGNITFTQAMTLDASGNLGIGTSSPGNLLTLSRAVSGVTNFIALAPTTNNSNDTYGIAFSNSAWGSKAGIYGVNENSGNGAGALAFYTQSGASSFSERARITSGGLVLINRTSAAGGEVPGLHISGSSDTTNSNYTFYTVYNNNTEAFGCRNDGFVRATAVYSKTNASAANVYVDSDGLLQRSTSSLRYKTDVQDATHGLAEVLALRPVTYKGVNNGDTIFGGLIAEEVHAAGLTEFVSYDDQNRPDALHYGNMVALLTKAMQEQQALIESLTSRVAQLEGTQP